MINHIYLKAKTTQAGNGVWLYGRRVDKLIDQLPQSVSAKSIVHFELGNNDPKTFWEAYHYRLAGGEKLVLTLHDPPAVVAKPFLPWFGGGFVGTKLVRKLLDVSFGRRLVRRLVRRADAVIVLNPQARDLVIKNFALAKARVFVAPLMPLHTIGSQPQNHPTGSTKILFFGNLASHKGLDLLLEAFHQANFDKSVELQIIGGWGDNVHYKRAIELLAKNQPITWLGQVSDAELLRYIRRADIVVLPYLTTKIVHASGPQILAMAAGKVVIASDIKVFNAEIIDHKTGLLFQPGNVDDLQDKLELAVTQPALRQRIGRAAAAYIKTQHADSVTSKVLAEVYSNL